MEPIGILLDIENSLTQWLFSATPHSEDDQLLMTRVLAARDKLVTKVNDLVLQRIQVAALNLTAQSKSLSALNEKIKSTAKTVSTAEEVIGIVSDVLGVLATVAGMIAAA